MVAELGPDAVAPNFGSDGVVTIFAPHTIMVPPETLQAIQVISWHVWAIFIHPHSPLHSSGQFFVSD